MAAQLTEITRWVDELFNPGSGPWTDADKEYSHLVVRVDWFDYEDYPIFIEKGKLQEELAKDTKDRIMEVYSVNHDRDAQLRERRAYYVPYHPQPTLWGRIKQVFKP
jgi:hypothetical protein